MFLQCPSVLRVSKHIAHDTSEFSSGSRQNTDTLSDCWLESNSSQDSCSGQSSRLKLALLDYKQFNAARTVQCHVRGFLTRRNLKRQIAAATTISRWWRGFWVRKSKFSFMQQLLQQRIIQYHHDMATKIQALFRGWMTRQYFQDFQGMKSLRIQYVEDMISSLYRKLHKMRKEHLLPGIYALRESDLLSKIEDLSCTFGYRFHNGRVRAAIAMKRSFINDRRHEFRKGNTYSKAPYPGPFIENLPDLELTLPKRMTPRLQRTILVYDKSMRDKYVQKVYMNYSTKRRMSMHVWRENMRNRFCKDFVKRIMAKRNMARNAYEYKSTKFYLDDLLTTADEYNCFCKPQVKEDSLCQ
ncbi:uncharacterized protein LOC6528956 [Drosophila yakuba]|uniref:Spermatogenesis-associated protein 17 n=1 Tax=Drosophila yakuba TaxID=7245 RepID=B4NXS5_DROYA|nr:uncharacterized protein LOC6528956 [Drosophila yakuba]EDW89700.2 uncharacterized protein Dyak_GE21222 [Drosophila yakuba]